MNLSAVSAHQLAPLLVSGKFTRAASSGRVAPVLSVLLNPLYSLLMVDGDLPPTKLSSFSHPSTAANLRTLAHHLRCLSRSPTLELQAVRTQTLMSAPPSPSDEQQSFSLARALVLALAVALILSRARALALACQPMWQVTF